MTLRTKIAALTLVGAVAVTTTFAWPSASSPATFSPTLTASPTSAVEAGSRAYLHSYNLPGHGVAIEGFSPVSYFEGRSERGSALFSVDHEGVTYHLTSTAQVETFRRSPGKFVPAFGGWCAFGMAKSDKFPVDPTNFKIVDGRLFLFLKNSGVDALEIWNDGDEASLKDKAAAHWNKVSG